MSIEYNTRLVYGFICPDELHDKFNEDTNYAFEDDFICADSWTGKGWLFGIYLESLEEGTFSTLREPTAEEKEKLFSIFCRIPPALRWMGLEAPQVYVMQQVS